MLCRLETDSKLVDYYKVADTLTFVKSEFARLANIPVSEPSSQNLTLTEEIHLPPNSINYISVMRDVEEFVIPILNIQSEAIKLEKGASIAKIVVESPPEQRQPPPTTKIGADPTRRDQHRGESAGRNHG